MDNKNTIIGVVLIVALIGTWLIVQNQFAEPEPTTPQETTQPKTSETTNNNGTIAPLDSGNTVVASSNGMVVGDTLEDGTIVTDSLVSAQENSLLAEEFGPFASAAQGDEYKIHVVTDKLDFYINTRGGHAQPIKIRKEVYMTYDSAALPIFGNHPRNTFAIQFQSGLHQIDSRKLVFQPDSPDKEVVVTGDEEKIIRMQAKIGPDKYLEQVYVIKGNTFDFGYEVNFHNINQLVRNGYYNILWENFIPVTEKEKEMMEKKATVYWRTGGSIDDLGTLGEDLEEEKVKTETEWVSFKSQFFTQTLIADPSSQFEDANVSMVNSQDPAVLAKMTATMGVPLPSTEPSVYTSFRMYNGPLQYNTLGSYEDLALDGQMKLGWGPLKYINRWFFVPVFKWLESTGVPYWVIIILLAFFVKLVLSPLTFRTFVNGAKMRVVNQTPEVKALEEKHKDDATKLQQAKMGVYNQMGVSPMGGCLPMMLQYPFLISLFFLFPEMIELRQVEFLWAHDLSTYDSILELPFRIPGYGDHVSLFCLLMAASIYVYTFINQKNQPTMNAQMKYLPYVMPLVFIVFLNNYAAGLSFYYFVSNILNIAQSTITKAFIDDEKVLAKLHEEQKKRKKSGKKGGRLANWMEKQQKKQQQMMKEQKSGKGGNRSAKRRK